MAYSRCDLTLRLQQVFELSERSGLRLPLPNLRGGPVLHDGLPVLSAARSPSLPRSHSRKPAQTLPVAESTALRLRLAAQLSSELPLLQSEEEVTARAQSMEVRLQPEELSSAELRPPQRGLGKALATEPPRRKRPVLVSVELAKRSVEERLPFGAAQSVECS